MQGGTRKSEDTVDGYETHFNTMFRSISENVDTIRSWTRSAQRAQVMNKA